MVIPAMDHIDEKFGSDALNPRLHSAIRASVAVAKRTCNRYYSRTDDSNLYRVAMGEFSVSVCSIFLINSILTVLHPRYKLAYFKDADWDDDWQEKAHALVREIYDRDYATLDPGAPAADQPTSLQSTQANSALVCSLLLATQFYHNKPLLETHRKHL